MEAAKNGYLEVANMIRQDPRVELTAEQVQIVDSLISELQKGSRDGNDGVWQKHAMKIAAILSCSCCLRNTGQNSENVSTIH